MASITLGSARSFVAAWDRLGRSLRVEDAAGDGAAATTTSQLLLDRVVLGATDDASTASYGDLGARARKVGADVERRPPPALRFGVTTEPAADASSGEASSVEGSRVAPLLAAGVLERPASLDVQRASTTRVLLDALPSLDVLSSREALGGGTAPRRGAVFASLPSLPAPVNGPRAAATTLVLDPAAGDGPEAAQLPRTSLPER